MHITPHFKIHLPECVQLYAMLGNVLAIFLGTKLTVYLLYCSANK